MHHWQEQTSETIKSMEGDNIGFGLFDNLFRQGYGEGLPLATAKLSLPVTFLNLVEKAFLRDWNQDDKNIGVKVHRCSIVSWQATSPPGDYEAILNMM